MSTPCWRALGLGLLSLLVGCSLGPRSISAPPPLRGSDNRDCVVEVACIDLMIVMDVSQSTQDPPGSGEPWSELLGSWSEDRARARSILSIEIEAVRALLHQLDPSRHAVGIVAFAGGRYETSRNLQSRWFQSSRSTARAHPNAWIEIEITNQYAAIRGALDRIAERGAWGATHTAAGVDLAAKYLALRGGRTARRVIALMTDGSPTLPHGPGYARENLKFFEKVARDAASVAEIEVILVSERADKLRKRLLKRIPASGENAVVAPDAEAVAARLRSLVASRH